MTPTITTPDESPIIVGLDIGTTKIAVIAGRTDELGKLEILGFGRSESTGVVHGNVINVLDTVNAIHKALQNCLHSNPQLEINEVYVGIAGHHIKSLQTRGDIVRQNPNVEIQQWEIDHLISNQKKTFIPAGDQIIDVIPQEFYIDNDPNTNNPIGCIGVKVGANFHIITGDRNAINKINLSVEKNNLIIKDLMLQPLASAAAVMSDVDLEAGVAILDIGGGTSDLAIFYEGILKHSAVIPYGGENITSDIKMGLGVLRQQAELMKINFGSALANEANPDAYITIPGFKGIPPKEISVQNLAHIIQARMTEILDFVNYHIKQIGLDNKMLNGGLIITGGGSQLKHLVQLAEYCTGLNVRIGYPNEHLQPNHNFAEELKKPIYATCLGMILQGCNHFEIKKQLTQPNTNQVLSPKPNYKPDHNTSATPPEEQPLPAQTATRKPAKFWNTVKSNLIELFREPTEEEIK